ncbi:MAG: AAA family ATPase [archaeon]
MWYRSYNWSKNPFNAKFNTLLVGFDKQKQLLADYISSGDLCILTGEAGTGKTSLLKWLQKTVKSHNIKYLSAEGLDEYFNLKKFTRSLIRQKKTVLLLDEAQFCDETLRIQLKTLWDGGHIKSAIIAQPNAELANFSPSIQSRIGNRVIKLKKMNPETAKELIELRTGGYNPFTDEMIEEIAKASDKNPRRILENCESICIALKGKEMTLEGLKELLEQKKRETLMNLEVLDEPTMPSGLSPIKKKHLKGFSPMQQKLLNILFESDRTAKQLAKILNSSEGSVGKQLSNLVEQNSVTVINHRRPKLYGLQSNFKSKLL